MISKTKQTAIVGIVGFFLGLTSGLVLPDDFFEDSRLDFLEIREGGYKFINPLLESELGESLISRELKPFKGRVEDLVMEQMSNREINHVSIYFRDMNNGPWFGINEREEFIPASLLKVPIMISVLKQAESSPALLDQKIIFSGSNKANQYFASAKSLEQGREYTVNELLELMVVYSNNDAKDLLVASIPQAQIENTFSRLGLEKPDFTVEDDLTIKAYATFFRILFNSSYLDREMSEKALELLSRTQFDSGLRAGVPTDITTANKFGEWWPSPSEDKQLHDCGIIYLPERPYLLCVMTRGQSFEALADVITNVSKLVYEEVKKQND